jgi:hypothetical protein
LKHIIISILFHQFKEITKLIDDVKQIEDEQEAADDVSHNNNTKRVLLMNEVKKEEELKDIMTTIDSYFISAIKHYESQIPQQGERLAFDGGQNSLVALS